MTNKEFIKSLDAEIKAAGIDNPVKGVVEEVGGHTRIMFSYIFNATSPLGKYLRTRFSLTPFQQDADTSGYLLTPNEARDFYATVSDDYLVGLVADYVAAMKKVPAALSAEVGRRKLS